MSASDPNDKLTLHLDEKALELLPVAVCVCAASGALRYFNRQAVELWGREPTSDDLALLAETLRTGQPLRDREALVKRPGGVRLSVLVNINPIPDEQGGIAGAVCVYQAIPGGAPDDPGQALGEFLADIVCTAQVDARGIVELESVSHDFSRLTGYALEEFQERGGVPFSIFPDDLLLALQSLERVLAGEQVRNEIRMVRKDGVVRCIRYLAQPEGNAAAGRVVRIRAFGQDVTERRQSLAVVQESERRFRQLAENIDEIFWLSDPSRSQLLYVSPGYERIWGQSCQSLYERPLSFLEAIHPEDRDRALAAIDQQARGEPTQIEYRIVRPDGGSRWIRDRGFPIKDESGQVYRVAGIAEDATEEKQTQEALQEADRRKDEFLAMLAHELRNPLAPIRNALHILKITQGSPQAFEQTREMMERQVGQMVRLIDDLLDISRITRNKLELRKERIGLAAVVQSAVESSRPLIEASGHQLTVTLPPEPLYLHADLTRLAQVFLNLLNNAAKYTERGGRIQLTAERLRGEVVVRVRDTGIGISREKLSRLFEMFYQTDDALERAQGGLGIGLTLVKRLVELHGGTVEAHSEGRGKGSEFVVRLPVLGQPSSSPQSEAPVGGQNVAAPRRRILVVDDNQDAAASLALLLRLTGNEVHTAADGDVAVAAAAALRPDAILMDIGMPKVDGHEAARRIRETEWGKRLVLVAVTGWGQEEDRRKSREAGFDHHLVKPVDPSALEALLPQVPPARA